ncbi:MAG: Phasin protein [Rhodobacteraceae bacterium HLUCCA08]|nr:MAG: Phasin protein [Rhodobacteraceae bacterium HLUCCA08]
MVKSKKPEDPVALISDLMSQWQQMGLGSLNAFGAGWFEKMSDMGSDWLRFVSDRVAQDVQFQHDILAAKSPADLHRIQSDFFRKAMDDYAAQTGRMVSMGSKLIDPD